MKVNFSESEFVEGMEIGSMVIIKHVKQGTCISKIAIPVEIAKTVGYILNRMTVCSRR